MGLLARIGAGERIDHYEMVRVTKHSHQLDVSLTISPLTDARGQVVCASKIIRDITDRKRTEQALSEIEAVPRESDKKFRSLADAIPPSCLGHGG